MRIVDAFTYPIGSLLLRPFVALKRDRGMPRARRDNAHSPAKPQSPKGQPARAHRDAACDEPQPVAPKGASEQPTDLKPATAYWRGASGRLYRHSAHTTVFCPAPQRGVYVLARRTETGAIVPLFAGVAASPAGALNLAHIRRRAVTIGATEVHLCPVQVTGSVFTLRRVARDLRRSFASAV
jgi:hypothetical protein